MPGTSGAPGVVRAELVGNVLDVLVVAGRAVAPDEPLVLLESMKMEIPVSSEQGGTVVEVAVSVGDVVQEGDVLVVLS
ncbi:MAG: biotin/lipoyl-binding carrier protein [Jiangellales bacterium]